MLASKSKFSMLTVVLFLAVFQSAEAVSVVSNVGDVWTEGGIGDIHGVFRGGTPYGTDTASFKTGAGTFSLNSITLEFEFGSSYSSPQWLDVQLFESVGGANVLIGNLVNPVADPAPTQWPNHRPPELTRNSSIILLKGILSWIRFRNTTSRSACRPIAL